MVSVVFDVDLDNELLENIGSLRALRLEALNKQLSDIDSTLDFLELQGAITGPERMNYRHAVQFEISEKIKMVEERVKDNHTIYSDELELYLELLAEPAI